jgi:hypothetical protein
MAKNRKGDSVDLISKRGGKPEESMFRNCGRTSIDVETRLMISASIRTDEDLLSFEPQLPLESLKDNTWENVWRDIKQRDMVTYLNFVSLFHPNLYVSD